MKGKKLTVINFHFKPHYKNPEGVIQAITDYSKTNPLQLPFILAGNFNVDEKEGVFDCLKT